MNTVKNSKLVDSLNLTNLSSASRIGYFTFLLNGAKSYVIALRVPSHINWITSMYQEQLNT